MKKKYGLLLTDRQAVFLANLMATIERGDLAYWDEDGFVFITNPKSVSFEGALVKSIEITGDAVDVIGQFEAQGIKVFRKSDICPF